MIHSFVMAMCDTWGMGTCLCYLRFSHQVVTVRFSLSYAHVAYTRYFHNVAFLSFLVKLFFRRMWLRRGAEVCGHVTGFGVKFVYRAYLGCD